MAELSIEMCRRLAEARRAKGLTQSALAAAVGCKQSAISMLEAGRPEKLSKEYVGKIAVELGLKLDEPSASAVRLFAVPAAAYGYCPDAECPSAVPYLVRGALAFKPLLQRTDGGATHCVHCGELLETHCPECGAPIREAGAFCPHCGAPRVTNTMPDGAEPHDFIVRRREEARALGIG